MLNKLLGLGIMVSLLSVTSIVNAGTLFVELVSGNNSNVSYKTVFINSLSDDSYKGQGISDLSGTLQIYNVPAGFFDVYVMDESGNVIVKYAGELLDENSEMHVSIDL